MPAYLGALDQGTTSTRFIVFDHAGRIVAQAQEEHQQIYPAPGWVEHDPREIWESQLRAARGVLQKASTTALDVIGLAITNQRETTVVWERATGRALRAIVWQDRRTADICEKLRKRGVEPMVRRKTGLLLDPYFSATKIAWMLDEIDGLRERAQYGSVLSSKRT